MNPAETELQVLLSEKEHADRQIASYTELQLKLLAFLFGVGSVVLGLIFATGDKKLPEGSAPVVIIVASIAGCIVMLQSVLTYGIALGYIHYKKAMLAPRLVELAQLPTMPPLTVQSYRSSPARLPVFLASALLAVLHLVGTSGLLVYAASQSCPTTAMVFIFSATWALLVITAGLEVLLALAMKAVASEANA
jgi:hypothetical protein